MMEEDSSTTKVLEGEPTFSLGLHAEILPVQVVNKRKLKGIKIKDHPLNDLSPFLGGLSPVF